MRIRDSRLALVLAAALLAGRADAQDARPATFVVWLPADARLFVDHVECPLNGATRTFATTPLDVARKWQYTLRAEAVRQGQPVRYSRKVTFRGGEVVQVDFGRLEASTPEAVPAGPRIEFPEATVQKLPLPATAPTPAAVGERADMPLIGAVPLLTWAQASGTVIKYVQVMSVFKEVMTTENVKRPDGTTVPETVKSLVTEEVQQVYDFPLEETRVIGPDGRPVEPERVAELLKEPAPVLIAQPGESIDPRYLAALKPGTLALLPPLRTPAQPRPIEGKPTRPPVQIEPPAPAPPKEEVRIPHRPRFVPTSLQEPAPKNPFANVKGPLPQLRLARVDANGTLHVRDHANRLQTRTGSMDVQTEGKTEKAAFQFTLEQSQEMVAAVPAGEFKAYDGNGNQLAPAGLAQRLGREVVVLLGYENHQPDPAVVARLREETPIIVVTLSRGSLGALGWGGYGYGVYNGDSPAPAAEATVQ